MARPEVERSAKGRARKLYEFGVKISLAVTAKEGFVLGARSMPGNHYDGHTLGEQREQVETFTGVHPKQAFVKSDELLGRCQLKGADGDAMHAVLCGAGQNLRLLLSRLQAFLRLLYKWVVGRRQVSPA